MNADDHKEPETDPDCKTCFGEGVTLIYFVNHKRKTVIQEWDFCCSCYPDSSGWYDDRVYEDGVVWVPTSKEAHKLVDECGYRMIVP